MPESNVGYEGWRFEVWKSSCWIDNEIAIAWLREVFVPQSGTGPGKETRLLVMDGHASHESDELQYMCFRNNIHLLYLPAHASHVLQPLDVGVFSSLK